MDINAYANDRLLDFCDAVHAELSRRLNAHFGAQWLELGVRKHLPRDYFERVQKMLQNPMRVVDMDRQDDELSGIEHLWNIINGNWSSVFESAFQHRVRTEAYLGEITELRHNLAHRRRRHCLLRTDLVRILGSCRIILNALGSSHGHRFAAAVDAISSGGTPWGAALGGYLPPSDEMYTEFIGRRSGLDALAQWMESDKRQVLVWGYGGAGKSALAYKFACDVRDSSTASLIAVCWVSAKRSEYAAGNVRERSPDFTDLDTLLPAIWTSLYGPHEEPPDLTRHTVLAELADMPILLVVDDFDTVSEDLDLTEFLLHDLRSTPTRVIYTSRQRTPALRNLEVPPFAGDELKEFVVQRAVDYSVDPAACTNRLTGIASVTGSYPLFVDDLVHHAAFVGIEEALQTWSQRKGDAAREYALRRQIQYLSHSSGEVLIALSVANRALTIPNIAAVAGLTKDDAETGVRELLGWTIVNKVHEEERNRPAYRMNRNTCRLVQKTFVEDPRSRTFTAAFGALTGKRVPEARRAATARIVRRTTEILRTESFGAAERHLRDSMTGELANSSDLFGVLGWLYSKQEPRTEYAALAREAFQKAHALGSRKVDTYYHWAELERNIAELMIGNDGDQEEIQKQWKQCEDVSHVGIDRCGISRPLCYLAGYGACREAKAAERARKFTYAQGAYSRSLASFEEALTAPVSEVARVGKGSIYRGLALVYEGLGNEDQLRRILRLWHASSESTMVFEDECLRLMGRFPSLQTVPEFDYLLTREWL